jgi:hypothetical protein
VRPARIGIVWYHGEEDYLRLKGMYADSEQLPDTFAEWLKTSRNTFGTLTIQGLNVVKVYIDAEAFRSWCKRKGFKMDGPARAEYVSELVSRQP